MYPHTLCCGPHIIIRRHIRSPTAQLVPHAWDNAGTSRCMQRKKFANHCRNVTQYQQRKSIVVGSSYFAPTRCMVISLLADGVASHGCARKTERRPSLGGGYELVRVRPSPELVMHGGACGCCGEALNPAQEISCTKDEKTTRPERTKNWN